MGSLKKQDLRLWNLVNYEQITHQITLIDRLGFIETRFINQDVKESDYRVSIGVIKPIPITEYWLLKLGFKSTKNDIPTYYKNFGNLIEDDYEYSFNIYVDLELNYFVTIFGRKIELKYVHQLQNLYQSITSEELTIN